MLSVIKIGGSLLGSGIAGNPMVKDLKKLYPAVRVILVHGGGLEVTETAEKLGIKQKFVTSPEGIRSRYTDKETVEVYTMVMAGKINKEIVAALQSSSIPAIGLSGIDGGIIRAARKKKLISIDERGRKMLIDGGYTGKITSINTQLISLLIENELLPVIAPLALGEEFETLNVDGDIVAANIAGYLKADSIIFLTDVQGVILNGKTVPKITLKEAETLLPKVGYGMNRKILAAIEAISMGVKEAIIACGKNESPISSAIKHETGTLITNE
jgi:acetylglutamate/LysW-gamma-L-alpha-aminoadipate kinase